jgi:CubicO group peptidase (beta-lactamase class C family)
MLSLAIYAASARPTSLQDDLQAIVNAAAAKNNCSVSLGIRMGDTKIAFAGGLVDLDGTHAKTSDPYAWGSVTKTITGAAIMRLVADGKLSLDDKAYQFIDPMLAKANYPYTMNDLFRADRWAIPPPVEYNATDVTIKAMLGMLSGIPDYDTARHLTRTSHPPTPAPPASSSQHASLASQDAFRHLQYSHPATGFSPLDLFDYVHGPLYFKPGGPVPAQSRHHGSTNYCSINCTLLGLVLAHFAGAASWEEFDQSAILPAALRPSVRFAGLDDLCSVTAPVHGLDKQSYAASPDKPFDVSSINCLGGWTAGNVVMSAPTTADWTMALFSGEVIPPAQVETMKPNATQHYGLALFNFAGRYANGTQGEAYGHLGDTYGFTSTATWFPAAASGVDGGLALAVATNLEEGQSAPSEVNCLAYNRILDEQQGRAPRTCVYESHSYYGGGCQCSP